MKGKERRKANNRSGKVKKTEREKRERRGWNERRKEGRKALDRKGKEKVKERGRRRGGGG